MCRCTVLTQSLEWVHRWRVGQPAQTLGGRSGTPGIRPGWWCSGSTLGTPDKSHSHSTRHTHASTTRGHPSWSGAAYRRWRAPVVSKYFFADVRGLIRGIGNNRLYFRKIGCHTVIDLVKDHAVMYIAGGNHGFQHKAVFVAGGVGIIGKLPLVLPPSQTGRCPGRSRSGSRCAAFPSSAGPASFWRCYFWASFLGPEARHHRQRASSRGPDGLRSPLPSVPWRSA